MYENNQCFLKYEIISKNIYRLLKSTKNDESNTYLTFK